MMNQQETAKFLTAMQRLYPTFFKDFNPETFEFQKKMWCNALYDYSFQECFTSLEIWFNTETFPPMPVQLKSILQKITKPKGATVTAEMGWETVDRAVRRYGSYGQEQAFNGFTEQIKRAVRYVGGWQKICSTELGKEWDFLRRNFIEAYNDFGQEAKEQELLPTPVLNRLQKIAEQRALENQTQARLEQGE